MTKAFILSNKGKLISFELECSALGICQSVIFMQINIKAKAQHVHKFLLKAAASCGINTKVQN